MEESALRALSVSVTIVGGYFFLLASPYRRFQAEHLRTDRFALHVLGFALLPYVTSVVIVSILETSFSDHWTYRWLATAAGYSKLQAPVIVSILLAPLLGVADSLCISFLMRRDPAVTELNWKRPLAKRRAAAAARFILKCDDAGTRLLHRATIFRKPLMITLKSGKVYVGQPIGGIGDPSVRSQSIKIIALYSGYRDAVTHKVELPTNYRDLIEMMQLRQKEEPANPADPLSRDLADLKREGKTTVEVDFQDMGIVILWSEIQTLSIYDDNIYKAFQEMESPEKKRLTLFGKDGLLGRMLS